MGHLLFFSKIELVFIRKGKNKSGNISIQIVKKINRKNRIVKHVGTGKTVLEIEELIKEAEDYLTSERIKSGKLSLFDNRLNKKEIDRILNRFEFVKAYDTVTYKLLEYFYEKIGLSKIKDDCFKDLVLIRIVDPASKRQSREVLEIKFNKKYSLTSIYRCLKKSFALNYQDRIEKIVYEFVKNTTDKIISVLFFDVTTLYYESFDEDDFRKYGFSKDNKHNQPQIIVALTIAKSGMPLSMKIFQGNKFEGHTIIPSITEIVTKFRIDNFVIVADSAMLNQNNLDLLEGNKLKYIVGARLGNLNNKLFEQVISLEKIDNNSKRIKINNNRSLIISYSQKRANKDRSDREKQIKKAQEKLSIPSTITSRFKFLATDKNNTYRLNNTLIEKMEKLEGLKGYVTNTDDLSNEEIIKKYSDLWQVEKAFRMSKSDLKARPIFHTVKESITAHLAIVFTALAVSRYIELKSNLSIAKVINSLNQIKEIIVKDKISKETTSKFTNFSDQVKKILSLTKLTWVT